ncbi:MAG: hypothetical protein AAB437_00135 [Patescibacteria group bacterium]
MKKKFDFSWILVTLIIFLISLFFYRNLWNQVITKDKVNQLTIQGESPVYEFVAETVRNNILSLKNPFSKTDSVLYPFGWRFALDDVTPIFGVYFLLLRPFLSIHQSFILIILLGVIISGLTMYYLLLLLKIDKLPALLVGLIFCYSPFVTVRIGAHPSYTTLYLFTFPAIFFIKLIREKKQFKKYLFSTLLAISLSIIFLTNLYFAVMMAIMVFVLLIINYLYFHKQVLKIIIRDKKYFLTTFSLFFLILSPWILEVLKVISVGRDVSSDWNDIISYSADLTNIFIPLGSNPFYRQILEILGSKYLYISNIFENFIYPGLIIIVSMTAFLFVSKKLPKLLKPIYFTALLFLVLTFGPFLKIFGFNLKIPLPYIIIPYIPYLQMARSPGRFIVPFIFLSSIIVAFVIQHFINKIKKKWLKVLILFTLFFIFIFDQITIVSSPTTVKIPNKIYEYLSKQKTGPVLEIPFSIRDSIKNFGYANVIWSPYAQLLHHQKIFGVYAGRIPNVLFNYYLKDSLIGQLGKIITSANVDYESLIKKINRQDFINKIDFYQISYVINKNNEKYSPFITSLFKEIGFVKIINEGDYDLYFRKPTMTITEINFDSPTDELALTDEGWGKKEPNVKTRWMMTKANKVFMSLEKTNKKNLIVEGEAIVNTQIAKVYVNDKYIGKMTFPIGRYSRQQLSINNLRQGLNIITFKFKNTHDLSQLIPGSKDKRQLTLHVKYIGLK